MSYIDHINLFLRARPNTMDLIWGSRFACERFTVPYWIHHDDWHARRRDPVQ